MPSSTSRELACQLLAQDRTGDPPTAAAAAAAAERTFQRLAENLVRWVGPDGSQALFTRALSLAQAQNVALKAVPPPTRSALFLDTLAASREPHDIQSVVDGVVTILVSLIDLLTRLIGRDLAIRLVAESASTTQRNDVASTGPRSQP